MTSGWTRTRLGDVISIKHGFAFSGEFFTDSPEGNVLLTPGNFKAGGGFKGDKLKYYNGPVPAEYILQPRSLVVSMTDLSKNMDTLGFPAWSPSFEDRLVLHNQRLGLVSPTVPGVALDYIYYVLCGADYRHEVLASSTGTTVHHTSPTRILAYEFNLPSLDEQRAIAATLGALDEKIESNARSAQLIDQLVRTIYLDWRARVETVEETTFGQFAEVFGGATPKTSVEEYWDGDLAWTTPTDVTRLSSPYLFSTSRSITDAGLASCTAVMHPVGTILMTSRATIGAFAMNQIPAATNQGFIAVRPRSEEHRWFLFEEMRSRVPEFLENSNGSTFLEISRGRFKQLPLQVPSDSALSELNAAVSVLHSKAAQLLVESRRLFELRESLLPELLSGRRRSHVEAGGQVR